MFRILLYLSIIYQLSWADIPFKNVRSTIFDESATDFEIGLYKSLQTRDKIIAATVNANAKKLLTKIGSKIGSKVLSKIPVLGEFLPSLDSLLEDGSDWKEALKRNILEQVDLNSVLEKADGVRDKMNALNDSLSEPITNETDINATAKNARKNLYEVMNMFRGPKKLFKKYPLIAAPLLIEVAYFISDLNPIIRTGSVTCRMQILLRQYRRLVLEARLDKLDMPYTSVAKLAQYKSIVMSVKYTNNWNTATSIRCEIGCPAEKVHYIDNPAECIKDEFSVQEYFIPNALNSKCLQDYIGLIRRRIDALLPIQLFDKYCYENDPLKSQGTITILKKSRPFSQIF